MAWHTLNTYISTDAVTDTIMNGIGNDLRTWGGNVDAGGYALANCLSVAGPTGANPLSFNANGSERMRITSAGNVGIGTTTAATKLVVAPSVAYPAPTLGTASGSFSLLGDVGLYGLYAGVASTGAAW